MISSNFRQLIYDAHVALKESVAREGDLYGAPSASMIDYVELCGYGEMILLLSEIPSDASREDAMQNLLKELIAVEQSHGSFFEQIVFYIKTGEPVDKEFQTHVVELSAAVRYLAERLISIVSGES